MELSTALRYFLIHETETATFITEAGNFFVYPHTNTNPQRIPYLTYRSITSREDLYHNSRSDLLRESFQLTYYSLSYLNMRAWKRVLKDKVRGWNGSMGASPGLPVHLITVDRDLDDYEVETKLYKSIIDITIFYKEG